MDNGSGFRDTLRERIVKQFVRKLEGMSSTAGNYFKWSEVVRTRIEDLDAEKLGGRTVAVFDRDESYLYQGSSTECTLRIQIEYWYKLATGQIGSTEAERIRGDLVRTLTMEQAIIEPETLKALTLSIRITASDKGVDGPRAGFVDGFLELSVIYRHKPHDPYKLISEP